MNGLLGGGLDVGGGGLGGWWALKTGRMDSGIFEAWLCCDELANFSPLAGLFSDPAKLQQTATGKFLSSTVIYGSPRKWNWKFWSRGNSFVWRYGQGCAPVIFALARELEEIRGDLSHV